MSGTSFFDLNSQKQTAKFNGFDLDATIAELKRINSNIINAIDRLSLIIDSGKLTDADIEYIKTLDFDFKPGNIKALGLLKQDDEMINIVCDATLKEAYERCLTFCGIYENQEWNAKISEYKRELIRIGYQVSFMFQFTDNLVAQLERLVDFFHETVDCDDLSEAEDYFEFLPVRRKAEKVKDLVVRKQIYVQAAAQRKMSYLTYRDDMERSEISDYSDFIDKCNAAIEVIEFQLKHAPVAMPSQEIEIIEAPDASSTANIKDFTTRRQVLAMYYLLESLNQSSNQIDRTVKARFIEFMTGKNYDSIYKTLSNPFKGLDSNNPQNAIKDMDYVKSHFENLGLTSIAQKIDNDKGGQ